MPRLSLVGAASTASFGFAMLSLVPASYLVVAGGASGSGAGDQSAGGSGGGAGGVLQGTTSLIRGNTYTAYVGAGAPRVYQSYGSNGTYSFLQGPAPLYTPYILSYGGGIASGSGGATSTYVAGQGNPGGYNGGSDYPYPYPGGGGAGATGGASSLPATPGNGGNGVVSTITGNYYGGGGGGGILIYNDSAGGGGGGAGGGGNGSSSDLYGGGGNGGTNTGGGGGGSAGAFGGGSGGGGGSGIVILRVLTVDYTGIVTGGASVSTSGAYKIITFTSSGTYTA